MPLFRSRKRPTTPNQPEPGAVPMRPPPPPLPVPTIPQGSHRRISYDRYTQASYSTAGPSASAPAVPPKEGDMHTNAEIASAFRAVNETSRRAAPNAPNDKLLTVENKAVDALNMVSSSLANSGNKNTTIGISSGVQIQAKTSLEADNLKDIREGVKGLTASLPALVRGLDEVAKIHPFTAVAVVAFRIVIELHIKRQDNDRKIGVLFLQMRDMMEALLQLRSIRDEDSKGPGGVTIKARMQTLVIQAAADIKECANACDAYAKLRSVVKVIMSGTWDQTLKGYIDLFVERRREFVFALSMHTGKGVDRANRKLDVLEAKLDLVLEYFARAAPPEEQELAALVQKRGGAEVVLRDDAALAELLFYNIGPDSDAEKGAARADDAEGLEVVKRELAEGPEVAIRKNFEAFDRKFRIQQREFAEEVRRVVHHEGDRIVEAVNAGAHDRILDPEIHAIWKEMRWPGHVKSRHFVLALRDAYHQQIMEKKRRARTELNWVPRGPGRQFVLALRDRYRHQVEDLVKRRQAEDGTRVSDQDEWALEWINMNRLQSIAEAFDDDSSGFVTIAEVNQFTSSRPKDWSLPHWLAYWAIGWQVATTRYRDEVVEICSKMFAVRSQIHPANRSAIDKYLQTTWKRVCTLTSSFATTYQSEALYERFRGYVEAEEQRLREGLETARYKVDEVETLALITGPGRIEQFLMPLLFLLLRRDFEIFLIARNNVINEQELEDSAMSLLSVFDAVDERHDDLAALFIQQRIDPAQQFKTYACELFDYWHDGSKFWSLENLRKLRFTERPYDNREEDRKRVTDEALNYPVAVDELYAVREDPAVESSDEFLNRILGRWNGFLGERRWPSAPMLTFFLKPTTNSEVPEFEATDKDALGHEFSIIGTYHFSDTAGIPAEYAFTQTYPGGNDHEERVLHFRGRLDEDGMKLSGWWGHSEHSLSWPFLFTRSSPNVLLCRPSPGSFERHRIHSLWRFAMSSALDEARHTLFSWSYLKDQRAARLEYQEIVHRQAEGGANESDMKRMMMLYRRLTYDDIRRCHVVEELQQPHPNVLLCEHKCDVCQEDIIGSWIICLQCGSRSTLNFHDKPACLGHVVLPKARDDLTAPHLPTHDFVKIRANIHYEREIGRILRNAATGLEHVRLHLFGSQAGGRSDSVATLRRRGTALGKRRSRLGDFGTNDFLAERKIATPTCVSCEAPVTMPCWYCIDCPVEANVFVCQECDENKGGVEVESHLATHTLVRCTEGTKDVDQARTAEERLTVVEGQLVALTTQMDRIEKVLQSLAVGRSV